MSPPATARKPILTIGMATHSDFYGVWQTLTDLRLDFMDIMPDIELVVIDNAPDRREGSHSRSVQNYLAHVAEGIGIDWQGIKIHASGAARIDQGHPSLFDRHPAGMQYAAYTAQGTSQSRNLIFEKASAPYVLVMDCHVKLWPGSLQRLIRYFDDHDDGDLLQGPLIYDNFQTYHNQMDDIYRGNMRGIWGLDERSFHIDADPFDIPAQGLGVFACRKDKWLGFNKNFRGFGGEEYYIHEKFRAAGKRTLCLPFLRWVHRFDRPGGTGYINDLRHRVRNYLIGHKELGMPLNRVRSYFRDGKPEDPDHEDAKRIRIPLADWETLCLDLGIDP
jgi:hypothetical protein